MDWNERYSIDDYLFGKEPAQALLRNEEHLVSNGTTLVIADGEGSCLLYTSPSPRDVEESRMPSSA